MRWFILGLVFLCLGGAVPAQDNKKDDGRSREERLKAIRDEAAKAKADYDRSLKAAKDDQEKKKLQADYLRATATRGAKWSEEALAIGKENPKDAVGLDALILAAQNGRPGTRGGAEAVQLIKAHHRADPKIQPVFMQMMRNGRNFDVAFLRSAAAENPSKGVKALAKYGLALALKGEAEGPLVKDEEIVPKLKDARQAFQAVLDEFGDLKLDVPPVKIADLVNREIKAIEGSSVGKVIQEIEGEDIDGKKFKISDYRGKVVLLDFWGHW